MIIDFFISLINGLISLFPSLPSFDFGAFDDVYFVFECVNFYLPVDTIVKCIVTYLVFFKFKFGFGLVKWLISRIVI